VVRKMKAIGMLALSITAFGRLAPARHYLRQL